MLLDPPINVSYVKHQATCYKNRKMHFVRFLGSQHYLPDEKMDLKRHYWMGIRLSELLTRYEFCSQNYLADENPATRHDFFCQYFPFLKLWIFSYQMSVLVPGLIIFSKPQLLVCLCLRTLYMYRLERRETHHVLSLHSWCTPCRIKIIIDFKGRRGEKLTLS